jgi:hypothetical protein
MGSKHYSNATVSSRAECCMILAIGSSKRPDDDNRFVRPSMTKTIKFIFIFPPRACWSDTLHDRLSTDEWHIDVLIT